MRVSGRKREFDKKKGLVVFIDFRKHMTVYTTKTLSEMKREKTPKVGFLNKFHAGKSRLEVVTLRRHKVYKSRLGSYDVSPSLYYLLNIALEQVARESGAKRRNSEYDWATEDLVY